MIKQMYIGIENELKSFEGLKEIDFEEDHFKKLLKGK